MIRSSQNPYKIMLYIIRHKLFFPGIICISLCNILLLMCQLKKNMNKFIHFICICYLPQKKCFEKNSFKQFHLKKSMFPSFLKICYNKHERYIISFLIFINAYNSLI